MLGPNDKSLTTDLNAAFVPSLRPTLNPLLGLVDGIVTVDAVAVAVAVEEEDKSVVLSSSFPQSIETYMDFDVSCPVDGAISGSAGDAAPDDGMEMAQDREH